MDSRQAYKIKAAALEYRERWRFSVIPIAHSGSKKPLIRWKEYQTTRPTAEQIAAWPPCNIAVVTGAISVTAQ